MCSLWSNWQYVIIGSDNGLAPNRQQAINWTNDGLVIWRIYPSLGLSELTVSLLLCVILKSIKSVYLTDSRAKETSAIRSGYTIKYIKQCQQKMARISVHQICHTLLLFNLISEISGNWIHFYLPGLCSQESHLQGFIIDICNLIFKELWSSLWSANDICSIVIRCTNKRRLHDWHYL